jgi:hypothetical protein
VPHPGLDLAEECWLEHLATPAFLAGVDRGSWGLFPTDAVQWPNAVLWIAAPTRPNSPERFYFFFDLTNYPTVSPTAHVWDSATSLKLDLARWPKGSGDVAMVFRTNWNNGQALYAPWDRLAMDSHPQWPAQFPGYAWKPGHTIVRYLNFTHELLHTDDYHGA